MEILEKHINSWGSYWYFCSCSGNGYRYYSAFFSSSTGTAGVRVWFFRGCFHRGWIVAVEVALTTNCTTSLKYTPSTKNDNNILITIQSITTMPLYESKSFKKLCLGDYLQINLWSLVSTPQEAAPAKGRLWFWSASVAAPKLGE